MRVLVTRPQEAAQQTAAKLARLGHEAVLLPLSKPHHAISALVDAATTACSAIVLTSAEAARALSKVAITDFLARPVYAVGQSTAAAAAALGFGNIRIGPGDAQGLAALLIEDTRSGRFGTGLPLLYIAGNPRKPDLENRLRAAAIRVVTVEAYRMEAIDYDQAALREICGAPLPPVALFYSSEAARNFFGLSAFRARPDLLDEVHCLCLGPRVAESLPPEKRRTARVSSRPEEDHLLSLL